MKTLRMFGMALIAIVLSANFASCSKEDTPEKGENGIVVGDKKLTRLSITTDTYVSFTYDDKGRLIKAEEVDGSDYSFTETMIWGDNAVKISTKELYEGKEYNDNYTLPIVNGLVQSYNFNSSQYTAVYNQSNRLIEWGKERDQTIIIWDGDKLVSATNNAYGYVYDYTLTYEKSCKKGHYPLLSNLTDVGNGSFLYFAHPELLGLRTTQLPASVTYTFDNKSPETTSFSYELDKQGYISKIITKEENSEPYTYTLTWE